MRSLAQHGAAPRRWVDLPSAQIIGAIDSIVRGDTAAPCGADLHLLEGDVPMVPDARILGHETVGTVIEIGSAATVHIGDRLRVSCTSARGHQRTLLHRCRVVVETSGQASHSTSATPDEIRCGRSGPGPQPAC